MATLTEDVPAGEYTLEISVTDGSFQGGGTNVTVSDTVGQIGSGTISGTGTVTIDLDPSAAG